MGYCSQAASNGASSSEPHLTGFAASTGLAPARFCAKPTKLGTGTRLVLHETDKLGTGTHSVCKKPTKRLLHVLRHHRADQCPQYVPPSTWIPPHPQHRRHRLDTASHTTVKATVGRLSQCHPAARAAFGFGSAAFCFIPRNETFRCRRCVP